MKPFTFFLLFGRLSCISLCLLTFGCGKSKKDSGPVDINTPQTLNDNTNSKSEEFLDQLQFPTAKYNDAMRSLKDLGCSVTVTEGVTSCPQSTSLESADSLYVLLATFAEGVDRDISPTTDYKLRMLLKNSVDIEISKVKVSPYLAPLVDDTNKQLDTFKVECTFGFKNTLSYQKRVVGISLMRDLCSTPDFISELSRLKTNVKLGGLVVSDENKFSYVTTFTRVTIDADASTAEVMEFLSKQKI